MVVGDSSRAAAVVSALRELGVHVDEVATAEVVADPVTVGLVDLSAFGSTPLTAEAATERTTRTHALARMVDARAESLAVVVVSSIDGRHGFGDGPLALDAPVQAAGIGFWKAAAKEWRHHSVRCLDVATDLSAETIANHVASEIAGGVAGDELEHGLDSEGLWSIGLAFVDVTGHAELAPDAVVMAIGGAQGIGADILEQVIGRPGRTIVLAGRTDPSSVIEPDEIAEAVSDGEIRAGLIAAARDSGERPLPAEIEARLRRIRSARRVRETIEALESLGATVEYHPLDARDPGAVTDLVEKTLALHGRVDLAIHAAGVIADAPIARKDPESVEAVLVTKTAPALALCDVLGDETTIVFFGSVAGRFGNAAQADYGAANEFLAKLAAVRRGEGADVRCLAWGPWDSGMVSSGLVAAYDALGIVPIGTTAGVNAFARELADGSGAAEVILTNSTAVMAGLRWPPTAARILGS